MSPLETRRCQLNYKGLGKLNVKCSSQILMLLIYIINLLHKSQVYGMIYIPKPTLPPFTNLRICKTPLGTIPHKTLLTKRILGQDKHTLLQVMQFILFLLMTRNLTKARPFGPTPGEYTTDTLPKEINDSNVLQSKIIELDEC